MKEKNLARPLIDRSKYDHPEHFDDAIREYRTSERYIPTPLEELLYELAGHRCTICQAPLLEIHHIKPLEQGGETTYENLIVLCPNCHTRVHKEDVPSAKELQQYKLKQEIAYELPVLAKISDQEKDFIVELVAHSGEEQLLHAKRIYSELSARSPEEAIKLVRKGAGYLYLESMGIISTELDLVIQLANEEYEEYAVALYIRLTSKGVKWVQYLDKAGRISLLL